MDTELSIKEKEEAIATYISNFRHDVIGPISSMVACAEVILTEDLSVTETTKFLNLIILAGKNILKMNENYLLLDKIERGAIELEKEEKSIFWIREEIKNLFFGLRSDKKLTISFRSLENEVMDYQDIQAPIKVDESLFISLLSNLLRNALEASLDAGGDIKVNIYQKGDICVSISNLGVIPDKIKQKLFQKFATSKKLGNGLGLYSAKLIAKAHGGDLVYQSIPDGTMFTIIIPSS